MIPSPSECTHNISDIELLKTVTDDHDADENRVDSESQRFVIREPQMRHSPLWKRLYLAPSYQSEESSHVYTLQVLVDILVAEPSGRLFRQLVVKIKLATEIGIDYLPDSVGVTDISVYETVAPGVKIATVEQVIEQEIEALKTTGLSRAGVERVQQLMDDRAFCGNMHRRDLAERWGILLTTGRTHVEVEHWWARIEAVRSEQVWLAARSILTAVESVTGALLPVSSSHTEGVKTGL